MDEGAAYLELQVRQAHLLEEDLHESDQVAERDVLVRDDALDLVEFCQMRRVDCLVPEDPVDAEHLAGPEPARLVGDLVQHGGGRRGRVRAQDKLGRLGLAPGVPVPNRPEFAAVLVHRFDFRQVLAVPRLRRRWVCGAHRAQVRRRIRLTARQK